VYSCLLPPCQAEMTVKSLRQRPESAAGQSPQKLKPVDLDDFLSESAKWSRTKPKGLSLSRLGSSQGGPRRTASEVLLQRPSSSSSTSSAPSRTARRPVLSQSASLSADIGKAAAIPRTPGARAVQRLDRKLSGEFKVHVRENNFLVERLGPVSPKCLSLPARKENFKKERYAEEIQRGEENGDGDGSPAKGRRVAEDAEHLSRNLRSPEEFAADCSSLNELMELYGRSLRMEQFDDNSKEEAARARREAEHQREEEAKRRARAKMKEARDPKKKIALRLNNKRQFEMDEVLTSSAIPMRTFDVVGLHGPEQHPVVDVRLLAGKCQGLASGDGVTEMLEQSKKKEIWRKLVGVSCCSTTSAPTLGSTFASQSLASGLSHSATRSMESVDERVERVKARRDDNYFKKIIHKLGTLATPHPYPLPFDLEAETLDGDGSNEPQVINTKPGSGRRKSKQTTGVSDVMQLVGSRSSFTAAKRMSRKSMSPISVTVAKKAVKTATPISHDSARAQKFWGRARALTKVLGLFALVNRRNRSIELVKSIMSQVGEWARMRSACGRAVRSARLVQAAWRQFAATKKKRCDAMARMWQRIEDHHLSAYFKDIAEQLLQERVDDVQGSTKRKKILSVQEKQSLEVLDYVHKQLEEKEVALDWKSYRIPPQERRNILSRFYSAHMQKHASSKRNFMAAVKAAIASQMEEIRFLKMFGHDHVATRNEDTGGNLEVVLPSGHKKQVQTQQAFWHISEQRALQLIALGAQSLSHEEHFQDHPANKDLSDSGLKRGGRKTETRARRRGFRRGAQSGLTADGSTLDLKDVDFTRLDETVELGNLTKVAEKVSINLSNSVPVIKKTPGKLDVDELFRRFTPLKEIKDEQLSKYKQAEDSEPISQGYALDAEAMQG